MQLSKKVEQIPTPFILSHRAAKHDSRGTKIAYTRSFIIKGRFSTSFIDIPNWKAISRKAFLITALGTPAPISRIICPRRIGATQPTRDPFPFPIR